MFIPGRDIIKARKQAQRNADWFQVPYVVFTDNSGNLRVERESQASSLVWFEIFQPKEKTHAQTVP